MTVKGDRTLFEAFEPDVMRMLQTTSTQVQRLADQLSSLNAATFAAPGGGIAVTPQSIVRVNLPVAYNNLLEIMVAAEMPGVSPFFTRATVLVPAGTTNFLVGDMPANNDGDIVYVHNMYLDNYSQNVLLTHQTDNDPPLLAEVPMTSKVSVLGSFLGIAKTTINHIITNNDTVDVLFIDDVQTVTMTDDVYRNMFRPLLKAQMDIITALAQSEAKIS